MEPPRKPGVLRSCRGQATTEMVLLFPIFMFFMFGLVKTFALLVLVQKVEIAAFYAARRWQLESHRNVTHEKHDHGELDKHILKTTKAYLGCSDKGARGFLDIDCGSIAMDFKRTQVWNVVTLTVPTRPWNIPLMKFKFKPMVVTKYVPNRDRPIGFNLPGI